MRRNAPTGMTARDMAARGQAAASLLSPGDSRSSGGSHGGGEYVLDR